MNCYHSECHEHGSSICYQCCCDPKMLSHCYNNCNCWSFFHIKPLLDDPMWPQAALCVLIFIQYGSGGLQTTSIVVIRRFGLLFAIGVMSGSGGSRIESYQVYSWCMWFANSKVWVGICCFLPYMKSLCASQRPQKSKQKDVATALDLLICRSRWMIVDFLSECVLGCWNIGSASWRFKTRYQDPLSNRYFMRIYSVVPGCKLHLGQRYEVVRWILCNMVKVGKPSFMDSTRKAIL